MNGLEPRINYRDLDRIRHFKDSIIPRGKFEIALVSDLHQLIKEIDRLHAIEDHLCPASIDGKFSHYIDDREPKLAKKFEDALANTRMKLDVRFERMDNRMCSQCNDPAHTLYVRRERATGHVAGRCMREDCEASRCLQEIRE